MANMRKEDVARYEGMAYALKVAKERGVDGLEEECKFRNASKLPLAVPKHALDAFTANVKNQMVDTFTILVCTTLHDEFGFGKEQLEQFKKRFLLKVDCIVEDYCTWQDNIDILREECDMKLGIRKNDKDVKF